MRLSWLVAAVVAATDPVAADEGARAPVEPPRASAEDAGAAARGPAAGEDRLAVFVLQRGFYLASDLGTFQTLGGTRGYSNLEPYVALHVGYDVSRSVSLQLDLAQGYAAANPLSGHDAPDGAGRRVSDYSLLLGGVQAVLALRPSERVAIEPRLGGGAAYVYPALTDPADPRRALPTVMPYVAGGVDLEYLTLLTDFSAGAGVTFYYVLGAGIPAVAESVSVRYTF